MPRHKKRSQPSLAHQDRKAVFKQNIYDEKNRFWENFSKKTTEGKLKYEGGNYAEAEKLWLTIVNQVKESKCISVEDQKKQYRNLDYSFCFYSMCLIKTSIQKFLEEETFSTFLESYSKIAEHSSFDFFITKQHWL